ncbi:MAG: hypothetical protein EZS28_013159 [Streblomastix strix]|uniref:Uncharacterized protein n=1 Tax=Streblomastix strix TaxID=222440 RepID=A0A5J4W9W3_9EUKA|nr:MAG: hypothetical protein EZS28_013159 [Streblomastix strix]
METRRKFEKQKWQIDEVGAIQRLGRKKRSKSLLPTVNIEKPHPAMKTQKQVKLRSTNQVNKLACRIRKVKNLDKVTCASDVKFRLKTYSSLMTVQRASKLAELKY